MFDFLSPISKKLGNYISELSDCCLGSYLNAYIENEYVPELISGSLVLFSVSENRNSVRLKGSIDFDGVRKELYALSVGNWEVSIVDLGQINAGASVGDTYFAVQQLVKNIRDKNCIPLILGGSQDLVYANYRGYDVDGGMINLVSVDARFDLGNVDLPISDQSFVGKIVVDKPYNLFNYTNLGYQTYYIAPEELDLIDKMFFESYRLGEVVTDLSLVEPAMRDADIVSVDLSAMESAYYGSSPNGLTGREVCAMSRYAGISDKVSSFGVYGYSSEGNKEIGDQLIAQIFWYFIEGVNNRWGEKGILESMDVIHYQVPVNDEVLSFYKSKLTSRWWVKIADSEIVDNILTTNTLLPCTYKDYQSACNQILPERWFNAKMKFEM